MLGKILFSSLFLALCVTTYAEAKFHEAETEPEKTLKALMINGDVWDAGQTIDTTPKEFSQRYTDELIRAINAANCPPGTNGECEPCNHPVLCCMNTEFPPVYLFKTTFESENKVEISYSSDPAGPANMDYRLLKDIDVWKLDGINCGGNGFNY